MVEVREKEEEPCGRSALPKKVAERVGVNGMETVDGRADGCAAMSRSRAQLCRNPARACACMG
jgi:hypothetical protein